MNCECMICRLSEEAKQHIVWLDQEEIPEIGEFIVNLMNQVCQMQFDIDCLKRKLELKK